MSPGNTRTPAQLIGELLHGHPEAASLQAEAGHRQALARNSAQNARRAFAAEQAARLGYEALCRRLDPRRLRAVNFAAGLLLLIVLAAGLTWLDVIQLDGLLSWVGCVFLGLAGAAVWLAGAWLAASAGWERRGRLVAAITAAAIALGLLLALVHSVGPGRGLPFGALVSAFALALAVGAAALLSRMESAVQFTARRRWHRARADHEAAAQTEREDLEALQVATETWLGVVRTRATAAATDDGDLVHEAVALAAALLEGGQSQSSGTERLRPGALE